MISNGIITSKMGPFAKPRKEVLNFLKRLIFDAIGLIILLLSLPFLWLLNYFKPIKKRKIMVGTHPIVSNVHYKYLLQDSLPEYDVDIFIFEDWLGEKTYYDISAKEILPKYIIGKSAYSIAPYFVLIWALRKYKGFFWHFDGAILERTLLWRIEPFILDLFGKRVVMRGYGTDQWSLLQTTDNLNFKFTLSNHRERYFMMDFKKIKRNYMWTKYADSVGGDIRYLPIVNAISFAHFYIETDKLTYNLNEEMSPIIISHFANHPERKGSYAIEALCKELKDEGYNIEYRSVVGVSREEALSILDESHIFIEHLFNGVLGTGSLEAMAKGNVVLSNIDTKIEELLLVQDYEFYSKFFKEFPLININIKTLKQELISLIEDKELLKVKIKDSRKFVENTTNNVKSNLSSSGIMRKIYSKGK